MEREVLKDAHGKKLGEIEKQGNHLVLMAADGTRLGHYDEGTNTTYDKHGSKVGSGNLLSSIRLV